MTAKESVTLFCRQPDQGDVARVLTRTFQEYSTENVDADTHVFVVKVQTGELRIVPRAFRESGDEFCRMILGMHAFVNRHKSIAPARRQRIAGHLDHCDYALGFIASPSFSMDARNLQVLHEVARVLDALIFDGTQLFGPDGVRLL